MKVAVLVLALAGVAAAAGGCGSATTTRGGAPAASHPLSERLVNFDSKPPYVNALDVDPETGDYLLTTNRGFWRIDPRQDTVKRIRGTITSGSKSSTVGTFLELLVTDSGELLGSGHPDTKEQLPPFLGLIASDDGGATWRVISRLGEADLHKILLRHDRMYAFDAVLGAMLISSDGGKTFTENFTPREIVFDFEVDPGNPERIFASTEKELYRSEDSGKSWRQIDRADAIRLVWAAPDAFFRAQRDGTVFRSRDGGDTWERVGAVDGEPYKFKALATENLLLALSDGTIVETKDGGRTWAETFRP